jgi:DNA-directed RNA polymerase specialized sigma subunit
MTSKEKIAWLKRYRGINRRIDRLLEEKSRWWGLATKRTQTISDMPHGGNGEDKTQLAIEKIIEIEHQVDDEVDKLSQVKSEIISAIKKLPDATYRYVLAMMYIKESKISEIAKVLKCSRHKIYNIHDKAINELNIL